MKLNVFCPEKLEKFNEGNIFQVSEIFRGFRVCFGTAAFDRHFSACNFISE